MVIELDYQFDSKTTIVQTLYIDNEVHYIIFVKTIVNLYRYLKGELNV